MVIRKHLLCVLAILLQSLGAAYAQPAAAPEFPIVNYQPVAPLPPGSGEFYHHDSTVHGNRMRGLAILLYAQGAYRVNCAQAAVLTEYQQSLALYNQQQQDAYFDSSRQRSEQRRQEQNSRQRVQNAMARAAKRQDPDGLSEDALNLTTGEICWPDILQTADYDTDRANLEFLFRKLLSGTGRVTSNTALIAECTERMKRDLSSASKKRDRDKYVVAIRFLAELKHQSESFKSVEMTASISAAAREKTGID